MVGGTDKTLQTIFAERFMNNLRKYGAAPYHVAVIHGGPGAGGEMAPVARELATQIGVLEPLQTEKTLNGQVAELTTVLKEYANLPVSLIGFSWGAWLSFILTAMYPALIKKLILVGSGPYEHRYVKKIQQTRLSRLNEDERAEYNAIIANLNDPHTEGKAEQFARLGQLAAKTDRYDFIEMAESKPENLKRKQMNTGSNPFYQVLKEAQEMRRNGNLLDLAEQIQSPVIALHGDYDPHPIAGVREPLSRKLSDFRVIEIEHCGHKPWIERQAKDNFYKILKDELLVG